MSYEDTLLSGWEDVYKKGQLTIWILLALQDGPKYMADIKEYIKNQTNGVLEVDDKSMYRALRRYTGAELVSYTVAPNAAGPDRKLYSITPVGSTVLTRFLSRNINPVLNNAVIRSLLR